MQSSFPFSSAQSLFHHSSHTPILTSPYVGGDLIGDLMYIYCKPVTLIYVVVLEYNSAHIAGISLF